MLCSGMKNACRLAFEGGGMILILIVFSVNELFYSFLHPSYASEPRVGSMRRRTWRRKAHTLSFFFFLMWLLVPSIMGANKDVTFYFKVQFHVLWNILLLCSLPRIFTLSSSLILFLMYPLPGHLHPLPSLVHGRKPQNLFAKSPHLIGQPSWVSFLIAMALIILSPCWLFLPDQAITRRFQPIFFPQNYRSRREPPTSWLVKNSNF